MKTFQSWTRPIRKQIADALANGEIEATDLVFLDDGGEYVVDSGDFFGVDSEDLSADMRQVGVVSDYIDQ